MAGNGSNQWTKRKQNASDQSAPIFGATGAEKKIQHAIIAKAKTFHEFEGVLSGTNLTHFDLAAVKGAYEEYAAAIVAFIHAKTTVEKANAVSQAAFSVRTAGDNASAILGSIDKAAAEIFAERGISAPEDLFSVDSVARAAERLKQPPQNRLSSVQR